MASKGKDMRRPDLSEFRPLSRRGLPINSISLRRRRLLTITSSQSFRIKNRLQRERMSNLHQRCHRHFQWPPSLCGTSTSDGMPTLGVLMPAGVGCLQARKSWTTWSLRIDYAPRRIIQVTILTLSIAGPHSSLASRAGSVRAKIRRRLAAPQATSPSACRVRDLPALYVSLERIQLTVTSDGPARHIYASLHATSPRPTRRNRDRCFPTSASFLNSTISLSKDVDEGAVTTR